MYTEKEAISRVNSQLEWEVDRLFYDKEEFKIRSNGSKKLHKIYIPTNNTIPFYYLDLLHEYIHALHYEALHPSLLDNGYQGILPTGANTEIKEYFNAAMDWFATGQLTKLCNQKTLQQMEFDYRNIGKVFCPAKTVREHLIVGLVSAQSVRWLKQGPLPGEKIEQVVDAFHRVNPENPTMEKLYLLVSVLFNVFKDYKLKLVKNNGQNSWKIEKNNIPIAHYSQFHETEEK